MRTQIAKWGNSLAVRLPREIVQAARLRDGETVELEVKDGVIRLVPAKPYYTLEELLAGITPENLPDEIFDDGPRGEEML
jgi:antitoxin MazE